MSLITSAEAAEYLRVALGTLQNWRSQGVGPAFHKLGAKVLYDKGELDSWVRRKMHTTTDS